MSRAAAPIAKSGRYTADIDVGGTFTDGFFTDGDVAHRAKVLTTPHDLTECFVGCLTRGAAAFDHDLSGFLGQTQVVRLSTTLGTNTLLQRRGPKVGLLVNAGAERSLYADGVVDDHPFLDPAMVRGIDGEIDADGRVVSTPSAELVLTAVRELVALGARIIAVSLRNSWRDPTHERVVRGFVRERYPVHYLRSVPLQLAHEVTASDEDHTRTNTVLLNAYLHGDLSRGLYRAEDLARSHGMRRPLLVVHAAGGSARVAKTVAVQTLSSGPAVAVRGAAVTAEQLGLTHVVTADMGGTSLDVAVLDGTEPAVVQDPVVAGMRIAVPVISTESIGAGGGSIAKLVDGRLVVGPESAGSTPGPVCYGKGGQRPTVTDANLLLGLLDAEGFLGGRMRLDAGRAHTVVERRLAKELDVDVQTAAAMVRAEVNAAMGNEVHARVAATGVDADAYTLFAFGGGGPLHGCDIAEQVGIRRVIGFPHGSVFSAFGSSTVDVWHRYSRTASMSICDAGTGSFVHDAMVSLRTQGDLDMRGEGFAGPAVTAAQSLVLERGGVRRELVLEHDEPVEQALHRAAELLEGAQLREVVVDLRAPMPTWTPVEVETRPSRAEPHAVRDVRWSVDTPAVPTPIVRLEDMAPGCTAEGPAVIDTVDTVYAVNPGWVASVTAAGNVLMERTAPAAEAS
ncbi:MAG: N-methylhydantoinase [Actinomycetota bacterium]|nr:N-methylhydantoinase [Actinomycetota bacterium]